MSALQQLGTEVEDVFGVSCHLQCDSPVLIDDVSLATHLYHISQEAVSNAIKHGKAKNIEITLAASDGRGMLTIQDDGSGFKRIPANSKGMGHHIMSHRAKMIGGTLDIQPARSPWNGGYVYISSSQRRVSEQIVERMMAMKLREDSARKTRIFIVDDHPIVREGLSLMMNREPDMMVCGEAEEATRALQAITAAKPDFLIVDISLYGPDGLDLLKNIRARYPSLPVLDSLDARRIDLRGTRAARRRQRLHHEAGSDGESSGRGAPDP